MVAKDNRQVFLNPKEFGEYRRVVYEGVTYDGVDGQGIPILLTKAKEKDRRQLKDDYGEGIFRVNATMHCALADIGGIIPEKGSKIRISEDADFYQTYFIVTSACPMDMVILELEVLDE